MYGVGILHRLRAFRYPVQVAIHKRRLRIMFLLGVVLMAWQPPEAWAGACEDGEATHFAELKKLASGAMKESDLNGGTGASCLIRQPVAPWNHKWAGKATARAFSYYREPSEKRSQKLKAICQPVLSGDQIGAKRVCVVILATMGIRSLSDHDVLEVSKSIFSCGLPLDRLALLGGSEAARAAEAQWEQEEHSFCGWGGCSCSKPPKSGKKRAIEIRDHKFDVMNALWHIGDPLSQDWLVQIAAKDTDKQVRKRAQRTLKHLR